MRQWEKDTSVKAFPYLQKFSQLNAFHGKPDLGAMRAYVPGGGAIAMPVSATAIDLGCMVTGDEA